MNNKESLFEFINEIIANEAARYAKGQNKISKEEIIPTLAQTLENNNHFGTFAHFSDLEGRFGINPNAKYNTPFGIYGYPVDLMLEEIKNADVPYAATRKFIHLFKAKNPNKLLNLGSYIDDNFQRDTRKIKNLFKTHKELFLNFDLDNIKNLNEPDEYEFNSSNPHEIQNYDIPEEKAEYLAIRAIGNLASRYFKTYNPQGKAFFYFTNILTGKNKLTWSKLLRLLNYQGIYDPGLEIIFPDEPVQGLVFSPGDLEYIGVFENKKVITGSKRLNDYNKNIKDPGSWIEKFLSTLNLINLEEWFQTKEAKLARTNFLGLLEEIQNWILNKIYRISELNILTTKIYVDNIDTNFDLHNLKTFKDIYKLVIFLNGKNSIENTLKFIENNLLKTPNNLLQFTDFLKTIPTQTLKILLEDLLNVKFFMNTNNSFYTTSFYEFEIFLQFISANIKNKLIEHALYTVKFIKLTEKELKPFENGSRFITDQEKGNLHRTWQKLHSLKQLGNYGLEQYNGSIIDTILTSKIFILMQRITKVENNNKIKDTFVPDPVYF